MEGSSILVAQIFLHDYIGVICIFGRKHRSNLSLVVSSVQRIGGRERILIHMLSLCLIITNVTLIFCLRWYVLGISNISYYFFFPF